MTATVTGFTAEHAAAVVDRLEPEGRALLLVALVERLAGDAGRAAAEAVASERVAAPAGPVLLSAEEARARLRMNRLRFLELVRTGEIPSLQRAGERTRRFRSTDIEAYLERLVRETAARRAAVVRPLRASRKDGAA